MNARSRFAKGQIVAVFTIILPVLLGVMALGADFSIIYFNWAMVQKAADAAALAGASQLTGVSGSAGTVQPAVVNYVNGYACMNGVSDPAATYPALCTETTHPGGFTDKIVFTTVQDTQVSVGIKRTVPYFFGKMIGLNTAGVAAKATAVIKAPSTLTSGMFPIGLQCTAPCSTLTLDPGQTVTFGSKFVGGLAPGNWDWLDVSGNGASTLGNAIQNGMSGSSSVGDPISTDPGNKGKAGPVREWVRRQDGCLQGHYERHRSVPERSAYWRHEWDRRLKRGCALGQRSMPGSPFRRSTSGSATAKTDRLKPLRKYIEPGTKYYHQH